MWFVELWDRNQHLFFDTEKWETILALGGCAALCFLIAILTKNS